MTSFLLGELQRLEAQRKDGRDPEKIAESLLALRTRAARLTNVLQSSPDYSECQRLYQGLMADRLIGAYARQAWISQNGSKRALQYSGLWRKLP